MGKNKGFSQKSIFPAAVEMRLFSQKINTSMIPVGVRLTPTSVASERDTKINNYKKKSAMIKIKKGLGFQAPFLKK